MPYGRKLSRHFTVEHTTPHIWTQPCNLDNEYAIILTIHKFIRISISLQQRKSINKNQIIQRNGMQPQRTKRTFISCWIEQQHAQHL